MRRTYYLVFILLLIAQTSFGQIYQNMAQPGYKFSRARFDSVLTIPMGLGSLKNISGGQDTGQIRFNKSDSSVYVWNGRAWIKPSGGGVATLSAIGSTANANGATITGSVLNLQPASATFGGVLTAGTQSIAGLKQFQTDITVNGAINAVDGANTLVSIFNDGGSGMIELSQTGATGLTQYGKSSLTLTNGVGGSGGINTTNLTAARTYEMPNNTGTIALLSDTSTLSNRINLKLNISDTAAMLAPYSRVTVTSYGKNAGGDSTILVLSNGTRYAAKDSVGGGGGGINSGTYAQRIALTPITGQTFYQTDERIGQWVYNGIYWEHTPPALMRGLYNLGTALTSSTSGTGSSSALSQTNTDMDSSMMGGFVLSTGTTTTGRAGVQLLQNFFNLPLDTAYTSVTVFRMKFDTTSIVNNYTVRMGFGSQNIATTSVDGYGTYFRIDQDSALSNVQTFSRNNSAAWTSTTNTGVTQLSLLGRFNTYVITANSKNVKYYINGVLVASDVNPGPLNVIGPGPIFVISVIKKTGTTAKKLIFSNVYSYITKIF